MDDVRDIDRWVVWSVGRMPLHAAAQVTVAHFVPALAREALCGASDRSRSGRRRYDFIAGPQDRKCSRCVKAKEDGS